MVTPDKTYALIVGIEKYNLGEPLNLNGAASDAYQFYQWLRGCEVPDQNIWLFLSCLEENLAKYSELNQVYLANRDEIEGIINHEIFQIQGELLYVFWGGHGITTKDSRERYVLCADADKKDYKCLNISTYLIERFKTKVCRSFRKQIFFFDTCADHLNRENLISCTSYPKRDDFVQNCQQVVLFSCEWGKTSKQLGKERTGLFSKVVREQLNKQNSLIDISEINSFWGEVQKRFEQLKTEGSSQQNPIIVHYQDPYGSIYDPFRATLYDQEQDSLLSKGKVEQLSLEETAIEQLKIILESATAELGLIIQSASNYFLGRFYCSEQLSIDIIIKNLNCRVEGVNLNMELAILLDQHSSIGEEIKQKLQKWLNEYGTIMSDRLLAEIKETVKQKVQQQGGEQVETSLRIAIEDDLQFPDQYTLKVWQGHQFIYTPLLVGQSDEERNEEQNTGEISGMNQSTLQDKLDFILGDTLTTMMREREKATQIWIEVIVTEKILRELRMNQKSLAQYFYSYQRKVQRRRRMTKQALYLSHPIIFGFYERNEYDEVKQDLQAKWENKENSLATIELFSNPIEEKERLFLSLRESQVIGVICAYGLNQDITDAVLETGTPIMIWPVEDSQNTNPSLTINQSDYGDLPLFIYNHNCRTQGGKLALLWDNPDANVTLDIITPF